MVLTMGTRLRKAQGWRHPHKLSGGVAEPGPKGQRVWPQQGQFAGYRAKRMG